MGLKDLISDDRAPYFPCFAGKLLGALAGRHPDQQLAYLTVLLRIYDVQGPCPDSLDVLARRIGINKKRIEDALDALVKDGKLVREAGGIHNDFARQVLTEVEASRAERRRAGSKGGKTAAKNRETNQRMDGSNPTDVPYQLESEVESEKKKEVPNGTPASAGLFGDEAVKGDWPKDYAEQFWATYPRRTEKKAALAKLGALRKSASVPWERFFGGVRRYARHVAGTEERYIKHPTTWLNRGCWDDEASPLVGDRTPGRGSAGTALERRRRERANEQGGSGVVVEGTVVERGSVPAEGGGRREGAAPGNLRLAFDADLHRGAQGDPAKVPHRA